MSSDASAGLGAGAKSCEGSAVEPCQLHGLGNRCGDRTHLVCLCAFLHHPMQNLQQLSGVVPVNVVEVLNDLLIGFMDLEVR